MNTPLSEQRKGEIAMLLLEDRIYREGVKFSRNTGREILDKAKRLGVPDKEAMQFAGEMVRKLVDRILPPLED